MRAPEEFAGLQPNSDPRGATWGRRRWWRGGDLMAEEPIRLGVVGCGGLTQSVHIPCVASLEAFRVVAVCDLREEAAQRAASRLPGSRAYTEVARLLDQPLDAVLVCAPPAIHEQVTLAALERGLHVFLEKPPSMTAAGARRLVDAAAGREQR